MPFINSVRSNFGPQGRFGRRINNGSSAATAARSGYELQENGVTTSGVYWISLPTLGATQVYCDMTTDGGGWMLFGYGGNTSIGNDLQIVFSDFGTISSTRSYGQASFSRFGIAKQIVGATSSNTQIMWRRTNDANVIMLHDSGELFNRWGGGAGSVGARPSNLNLNGSGSGFPITNGKLSNSGPAGLVTKTNMRYENGPDYPGIAWNSTYNNNDDNAGSFTTFLNRRSLIYWETNGVQSSGQWSHGDMLRMGPARGPFYGTDKLDLEVYVRFTTKHY